MKERERESARARERERETEPEPERKTFVCVFVFVCVFKFILRFPSVISNSNTSGLWYYNVNITWFGEDGISSSANFADVFKTKITDTNSFLVD